MGNQDGSQAGLVLSLSIQYVQQAAFGVQQAAFDLR
jgi:hypothetical protein